MDGSDSSNAESLADAEEIAQITSAQWLPEQKATAAVRLRQLEGQGGLPQDVYRAAVDRRIACAFCSARLDASTRNAHVLSCLEAHSVAAEKISDDDVRRMNQVG